MPSLDQLHKLLAANPADPFILYGLAQEHARLKDYRKALEFYDRCLAADPAYCYAYFHKARAQEGLGLPADAAATLRAGQKAAKASGDSHALAEISGYLDEIEP
jgi:tetratricopeptide (TPR) repeat protein